ncbi:AAA family ATPase [Pseudomonas sp. H9]|uniref:AAA family ATPase n=1 Tax=Pseudomonas sp. H9 TaxID=483968 RepID=UPI0010579BD1|nr:AAA family ATPase [Pseudomonas sp. H9]TDF77715.1 AAA family ATPase [Pseudomonas sp. H9]
MIAATEVVEPFGELVNKPIWLAFVLEWNEERKKFDKIPSNGYTPHVSTTAKSWLPLAQALRIKEQDNYPGVTMNMTGGIHQGDDTLVGFDFDNVTEAFEPPFNSYAERSPSGKGVRMFAWMSTEEAATFCDTTDARPPHCDHCEVYFGTSPRHLTVTFDRLNDKAITRLSAAELASWNLKLFKAVTPMPAIPDIEVGEPFDWVSLDLNADQRHLVEGTGDIDRSNVLYGLIIKAGNADRSRNDTLASMLHTDPVWAMCLDHRGGDPERAMQYARDQIDVAYPESLAGKREALIGFNAGWGAPVALQPTTDAPTITGTPLLIERPITNAALTTPIPPWPSVIGGYLPLGVVTEFDGAHGIGKSTIGLHMALSVACNVECYGIATQPGKAVFASKEDPYEIIMQRIQAWLEGFDPGERPALQDKIRRNLMIYGCDETEALMLTSSDGRICSIREDIVELLAERWQGAVLVVLETASLLHGGDELNEDLLVLVAALKRIASRLKAALILIRHISKSAAREGIEDSLVGRGGASFSDAVRSVILLKELTAKEAADEGIDLHKLEVKCTLLKMIHTKSNYGEKDDPIFILRKPGLLFQRVEPRGKTIVNGERLLLFMRKEGFAEEWSYSKLKGRCTEIAVSQSCLKGTLAHLEFEKKIKKAQSTKGGNHAVWVLNQ